MTKPKKKPDATTVLEVLEKAGNDLDLSRLASELVKQFKGFTGLAKEVKLVYDKAPSYHAKGRMIEMVMRIVTVAGEGQDNDPFKGLVGAETGELQATLRDILGGDDGRSGVSDISGLAGDGVAPAVDASAAGDAAGQAPR